MAGSQGAAECRVKRTGKQFIVLRRKWKERKKHKIIKGENVIKTFVMGPAVGRDWADLFPLETELPLGRDLKACIVWETPSARINCSRNSIFVRPLAIGES